MTVYEQLQIESSIDTLEVLLENLLQLALWFQEDLERSYPLCSS